MTDLSVNGVEGVHVIVYGTTLDTSGHRELLNLKTVSVFYPYPHCLHQDRPTVDIVDFWPWTHRRAEDNLISSVIRTCTVMRNDGHPLIEER